MNKLVILFVCLSVLGIATALQCYKCENCQGSSSSWEKITCGNSGVQPPVGSEWACLRLDYKDRTTYKDTVARRCVTAEKKNGQLIFNCPTTQGEPTTCPVCQKDLCNSASTVKFSFVAVVSVVVAVLAPKFL